MRRYEACTTKEVPTVIGEQRDRSEIPHIPGSRRLAASATANSEPVHRPPSTNGSEDSALNALTRGAAASAQSSAQRQRASPLYGQESRALQRDPVATARMGQEAELLGRARRPWNSVERFTAAIERSQGMR